MTKSMLRHSDYAVNKIFAETWNDEKAMIRPHFFFASFAPLRAKISRKGAKNAKKSRTRILAGRYAFAASAYLARFRFFFASFAPLRAKARGNSENPDIKSCFWSPEGL